MSAKTSGLLTLVLGLLLAVPAEAQKNCTKGIPCGNTCISASKVCRVGTSTRTLASPQATTERKPTCTTGVRCGNACISADRVCWIEGGNAATGRPRDERGRFIRSSSARARFMRLTGYPNGRPGYIVDHIIPLACGGPDTPENMQWQTIEQAKAKDAYERKNC